MIIVAIIDDESPGKKEKFAIDLSVVTMSTVGNILRFMPITNNDLAVLEEEYDSVGRAHEVFNDIIESVKNGNTIYYLPGK